ncbi:MAG: urea transporter [Candidatus Obscuribacterales bacterium]|nr:urea transporter [Candidatus Obscuribacterales bacterium]
MVETITRFVRAMAIGMGQIMLQRNAWTGLLFLVGVGLNSIGMLAGALLGLAVATATALLLKADKNNIDDGLYGFNGALVGIAAFFFLPMSVVTVLLAAGGSALSTAMMHAFLRAGRPAYTAPFIVVTWAVLLVSPLLQAAIPTVAAADGLPNHFSGLMQGLGQVMFQGNTWSGAAFLLGLCISSRRGAVFAVIGSGIGMMLALVVGLDPKSVMCGLFGYNSALCAIALSKKPIGYPILAAAATVAVTFAFMKAGVTALTAPFVLVTWSALLVLRVAKPKVE